MPRKTKAPQVLQRASASPATDPLADPRIIALGARFQELRREAHRDLVDFAIEAGALLEEGRRFLRGHFGRWLKQLGVETGTARNYRRLAGLANESPSIVQ